MPSLITNLLAFIGLGLALGLATPVGLRVGLGSRLKDPPIPPPEDLPSREAQRAAGLLALSLLAGFAGAFSSAILGFVVYAPITLTLHPPEWVKAILAAVIVGLLTGLIAGFIVETLARLIPSLAPLNEGMVSLPRWRSALVALGLSLVTGWLLARLDALSLAESALYPLLAAALAAAILLARRLAPS